MLVLVVFLASFLVLVVVLVLVMVVGWTTLGEAAEGVEEEEQPFCCQVLAMQALQAAGVGPRSLMQLRMLAVTLGEGVWDGC